jgi:hypothetical protein
MQAEPAINTILDLRFDNGDTLTAIDVKHPSNTILDLKFEILD